MNLRETRATRPHFAFARLGTVAVVAALAAAALSGAPHAAHAQLTYFTDRTAFLAANANLTLANFEGTTGGTNRIISGPISSTTAGTTLLTVVPGITVQSVGPTTQGIYYNNSYNTGNGTNVLTTLYSTSSQDVTFDNNIMAYGVDLGGTSSGGTYTISVFNSTGTLIGTNTSTPTNGTFNFFGFTSTDTVARVNIAAPSFETTDNMVFAAAGPAAVGAPEPGTLPLLGMGLVTGLGMIGTVRRRKAKQQA